MRRSGGWPSWRPGSSAYDLRHAFASLQVRAGLSIPELAEQMVHSPATTLNTTRT
jgi:integrase